MTLCNQIEPYLNGALSEKDRAAVEAHVARCETCHNRVYAWHAFEYRLGQWAESESGQEVTAADAFALMHRATSRRETARNTTRIGLVAGLSVAAAAAAVFVAMTWTTSPTPQTAQPEQVHIRITAADGTKRTETVSVKETLDAPADTPIQAAVAEDVLGLSAKGRVRILKAEGKKTRLRLETGTVACNVAKRQGDEEFVVEAGELTVKVVGTRFAVTRSGERTGVTVEEGVVAVTDQAGRTVTVRAGEGIESDSSGRSAGVQPASESELALAAELLTFDHPLPAVPKTPPVIEAPPQKTSEQAATTPTDAVETKPAKPQGRNADRAAPSRRAPAVDKWQEWILSGRGAEAAGAMRRHLKSSPNDAAVWALLADCERKLGNTASAVAAYDTVADIGTPAQASRAIYMAASLLQSRGEHRRALELFNAFKQSEHAAADLLRLADVNIVRSLVALGRCTEAEAAAESLRGRVRAVLSANLDKILDKCRAPKSH